jgi:hypothetical protein
MPIRLTAGQPGTIDGDIEAPNVDELTRLVNEQPGDVYIDPPEDWSPDDYVKLGDGTQVTWQGREWAKHKKTKKHEEPAVSAEGEGENPPPT